MMKNETNYLIAAYLLDGKGGGRTIQIDEANQWTPDDGLLWLHFDYTSAETQQWLDSHSGLDPIVISALIADDARPRYAFFLDGLLLALRGLNHNPGADPEDMVSIRIWVNQHRIISTRRTKLLSIDDLKQSIHRGSGPCTPGDFVVDLTAYLAHRMSDVIDNIDDSVAQLEDAILTTENANLRTTIGITRRQSTSIRRYLAPQRDVLNRLQQERTPLFTDLDRMHLRETTDSITRYVEDLDAARDRAAILSDELMNRISEQLNKRMYLLTVVAALLLPLTFITGLLGINVGGIPGAENTSAFTIVTAGLGFLGILIYIIFKQLKWI